jgi:hypothetical protein
MSALVVEGGITANATVAASVGVTARNWNCYRCVYLHCCR